MSNDKMPMWLDEARWATEALLCSVKRLLTLWLYLRRRVICPRRSSIIQPGHGDDWLAGADDVDDGWSREGWGRTPWDFVMLLRMIAWNSKLLSCSFLEFSISYFWTNVDYGIPVELFQILKDDAIKVLHSMCQQIWKIQQWPQDWKRLVLIPIPKKDNAKECSNYHSCTPLTC